MTGPSNRRVVVVAYDRLCAFEFGVASELFGLPRPEVGPDWYDFEVVSVDAGPIRAVAGLTITAPTDLTRLTTAGTIVVPGWRDPAEPPPQRLLDAIVQGHAAGARIMSICSGVFVVAASGLLDGKAATTHWRYTDQLRTAYPTIDVQPDVLYVDNGSVLTSAGSAAGLDLGLHLIRRDYGTAIANTVARRLVVAPHRDGGQAQFVGPTVAESGPHALAKTIDWAVENLDQSLTVETLANHANMTGRTFARRFRADLGTTPHHWLTQQRITRAQNLLETTNNNIDEIARQCGFGSAATLRHHFSRATKTTPTRYRSRFADTTITASASGLRTDGDLGEGLS